MRNCITQALKDTLGCTQIKNTALVTEGILNDSMIFDTDKGRFFVKINQTVGKEMFEAEMIGLQTIMETKTVRVPVPFYVGKHFLIQEYIEFHSHDASSQAKLGNQLAKMHLTKGPDQFGFERDNTIGTTPQINTWSKDWVDFFAEHRLAFQLKLVEEKYGDTEMRQLGDTLLGKLDQFFKGLSIVPSLLHGDLWGGNTARDSEGNPVIYDPAVYYGHHEADLSIAAMFGGFTPDFYEAYHKLIPKEPGFDERQKLYQLYHYLNHYYLFGRSYRENCHTLLIASINC